MDATALLEEEARGWERLTEAFGAIPPERFEEPTLTLAGWSPKDLMFHVAAWSEEAARVLGRIAVGTHREGVVDVEGLNRDWFEVSRGLDPDVVRLRFAKARVAMRGALKRLEDVDAVAAEWFDESGARHYEEHLADLRAFPDR